MVVNTKLGTYEYKLSGVHTKCSHCAKGCIGYMFRSDVYIPLVQVQWMTGLFCSKSCFKKYYRLEGVK